MKGSDVLKIYGVFIEGQIAGATLDRLMSFPSVHKQEGIKRFRNSEDALRTLISDILARTIVHEQLKIDKRKVIFHNGEYGKPYLESVTPFHFNLSHSGRWVVCAADNEPVGIDIELVKPIDLTYAKHFLTQDECVELFSYPESERLEYFYQLWTLKESYIKAIGKGLFLPLQSFTISTKGRGNYFDTAIDGKPWYFKCYQLDSQYKAAVCASNNGHPEEIAVYSSQQLIREFLSDDVYSIQRA